MICIVCCRRTRSDHFYARIFEQAQHHLDQSGDDHGAAVQEQQNISVRLDVLSIDIFWKKLNSPLNGRNRTPSPAIARSSEAVAGIERLIMNHEDFDVRVRGPVDALHTVRHQDARRPQTRSTVPAVGDHADEWPFSSVRSMRV